MTKRELETMPPFVILSVPVPLLPTYTEPPSWKLPEPDVDNAPESCAPTPISTSLAAAPLDMICAVPPLLINAVVFASGIPADQFAGVNQLPVPSVHSVL